MSKKIVVITGSPRKNGNSFAMTEAFIKAAEKKGHTITRFDIATMNVGGCRACETCFKTGKACSFNDDFNTIAPAIQEADAVVFSTPVYWYSMIDIRAVIATYRRFKLKGKRDFKPVQKQDLDLAFTKEEAQKIVVYALSHPSYNAFAVAIMITTGLRASELLGLETEDVDLCKGRIWVHQMECTKTYDIEQDCKDHSIRYVYLTPDAELVLSKAVNYRLEDESISPFLLLNPCSSDGKLHLRAIDHYLREYVHHEILGLSHDRNARSCHDCRRTYASLEYLSGTDIRTIKQQMGHNTEQQTWDYIHEVIDAEERKNRLKGGNLLGNSQKPHKYALDAV